MFISFQTVSKGFPLNAIVYSLINEVTSVSQWHLSLQYKSLWLCMKCVSRLAPAHKAGMAGNLAI